VSSVFSHKDHQAGTVHAIRNPTRRFCQGCSGFPSVRATPAPDGAKMAKVHWNGKVNDHEIPFWEFLDIEFGVTNRRFRFVAYYKQEPSFPHLFHRLIGSPALRRVADEIEGKKEIRIHKQDWTPRSELEFQLGASNVI
jgi:hypothetical protein